jgi:uncharacterized protein (TIGR02246 family)
MPNEQFAASTDEQQIRRLMDDWRRLTADGDIDGLAALTTDDVMFLTPGNQPITKNDFINGFRQVSMKARIESTQNVREIRVSGDLAYAWSHISVVLTPKEAGGQRRTNSGHVLSVFQRSPAGKWLLARDANLMTGAGNPERV